MKRLRFTEEQIIAVLGSLPLAVFDQLTRDRMSHRKWLPPYRATNGFRRD